MSAVHVAERTLVVQVRGELDRASSESVTRAAGLALAHGYGRLVLDLADVTLVDHDGLAAVLLARQSLQAAGGSLAVRDPSQAVRRALATTGVDLPTADRF